MTFNVRDFRPEDAAAVAGIVRAAVPYMVTTPEGVAWQVAGAPAARRYRLLVADEGGRLAGCVRTGVFHDSSEPGQAFANVNVHPAECGRGAGAALLAAAEEHLAGVGATTVYAWALENEASVRFAQRRGYRPGRSAHFQRLDLAQGTLPRPGALPDGVEVRTAADFAADPRPVYEADLEAIEDEPGDVTSDATAYQDWLADVWNHPHLNPGLTSVVVADGEIAALSFAETDGRGRYWSGGTGTRRAYRGRGLAKLAKAHSLHRARAEGCTEAFTNNDTGNGPMLAVNTWLGYQPCATERRYMRDVGAAG
jgi:GNAT superfamily N-acetyltransferase